MKRKIIYYCNLFLVLFIFNLLMNHFLKKDLDILTACSAVLGLSVGMFLVEWRSERKGADKVTRLQIFL